MSNTPEARLAYWYAIIRVATGKCIGIETSSEYITQADAPNYVLIEGDIPEYMGKYYINGSWYEDAAGTIPWAPTT